MRYRIFSTVILMFVLAVGFVSAQEEDERLRLEREEREKGVIAMAQQATTPVFQSFVNSLLPAGDGSWAISISKGGGIMGNPAQLIAVLNSDGIRSCGSETDTYSTSLIDTNLVTGLESSISGFDLKQLLKQFNSEASFCHDCKFMTMEIAQRENNKAKSHVFSWSFFPEASVEIKKIYTEILSATQCQ